MKGLPTWFLIMTIGAVWLVAGGTTMMRAQVAEGGWIFEYQREEIAPRAWEDAKVLYKEEKTLAVSGKGLISAYGTWTKTIEVEPGRHYEFETFFKTNAVEEPHRCVLSRLLWFDAEKKLIDRAEYPKRILEDDAGEWREMRQTYTSPQGSRYAKLELVYRWDPDGVVHFGGTKLSEAAEPGRRPVRISTIYHRPRGTRSARENLDSFGALVRRAAQEKPDIICLPEGITVVSTGMGYAEAGEPVPGPTTAFLRRLAKEYRCYIVAGLYEREGAIVYNTSVLLDRDGELAGRYRKVCLPREEYDGGLTPGDSFPVFDTDFGRIGMLICWDLHFPDGAKILALNGAEVILLPIWGGNKTLARARAIENQIYLVTSSYDMETAIFGLDGEIMAQATEADPIATADIDLNERKLWDWLGDYKNRIPREMPPLKAIQYPSEKSGMQ